MVLFHSGDQLRSLDTDPGEMTFLIGTNGQLEWPLNQGGTLEGRW